MHWLDWSLSVEWFTFMSSDVMGFQKVMYLGVQKKYLPNSCKYVTVYNMEMEAPCDIKCKGYSIFEINVSITVFAISALHFLILWLFTVVCWLFFDYSLFTVVYFCTFNFRLGNAWHWWAKKTATTTRTATKRTNVTRSTCRNSKQVYLNIY